MDEKTTCDKHNECLARIEHKIDDLEVRLNHKLIELERKYEAICNQLKRSDRHGERIAKMEQAIAGHQKDLNGNAAEWVEHKQYARGEIEKQAARDEKMDDDIKGLRIAITEMTTALVKSEASIRSLVDSKIDAVISGWRKMVIGAAGVMLLTCASAIGTLVILYIQATA